MASYLRDEETGEFIDRIDWVAKFGAVPKHKQKSSNCQILEEFISPIDGSRVGDFKQLAEHNKKHGVTNINDYSEGHFEKGGKKLQAQARGQTAQDKKERCQLIDKTLNYHGV